MPTTPRDYDGAVRRALPPFFDPVEVAGRLPSTMARAAELAEGGAPEGATVVADAQDAGRGRLGRGWLATPGSSLLFTVVLRPRLAPVQAWLAVAAAGVALVDATRALLAGPSLAAGGGAAGPSGAAPAVGLKWPNDLLVDGRKAAGILAEARSEGNRLDWVLLGIGGGRFAAGYRTLAAGEAGPTLAAYRERLDTIGRQVRAELLGGVVVEGVATGLGGDGALVVRTAAGEVEVAAGDVEHLRTPDRTGPVSRRP